MENINKQLLFLEDRTEIKQDELNFLIDNMNYFSDSMIMKKEYLEREIKMLESLKLSILALRQTIEPNKDCIIICMDGSNYVNYTNAMAV